MRLVLIGDGDSPHLLKWARALAAQPQLDLWAASSRGFLPGFDAAIAHDRRFALNTAPDAAGGNWSLLRHLPRLASWLRSVDADWLHVHYLTSHGTLAWLARLGWGLRARIAGSAWGTDILITPELSPIHRWLTGRVLRACSLTTSDSAHMTRRMIELGAGEVQTFPLGLDKLPPACGSKEPWLFFTNRALEPLYRPGQVLELFARIARDRPDARLVVANDGSIRTALQDRSRGLDCGARISFVGRLDAATQAEYYDRAQWFLSLPASDSIAVSVIEAMSHGAIPILSDLPANRELVRHGENGWIVASAGDLPAAELEPLLRRAATIAAHNRDWVGRNALFGPCVERFVASLRSIAGDESS